VNAKAAAADEAIENRQDAQKQEAVHAAHRDLAEERTRAEIETDRKAEQARAEQRVGVRAADEEIADALEGKRQAVQESESAQQEAARIRRAADNL
jgi:hypothetical protein